MANRIHSLRRKSDFQELYATGKTIKVCPWFFIKYKENQEPSNRFGWSISKKIGKAVVRNRLRRWLRNYFRHKEFSKTLDLNVILLPQTKDFYKNIKWKDFERQLERAWLKIQ